MSQTPELTHYSEYALHFGRRGRAALRFDGADRGPWLRNTLKADKNETRFEALSDIYRVMRPGEPPTQEAADACDARVGLELLELPESEEVVRRGAMNFVTLAPGHLVMPSGCPVTRGLYRSWGLKVDELEVSEYLKAAGALGCLTGILEREAPS